MLIRRNVTQFQSSLAVRLQCQKRIIGVLVDEHPRRSPAGTHVRRLPVGHCVRPLMIDLVYHDAKPLP